MADLITLGKNAKAAAAELNRLTDEKINAALLAVAKELRKQGSAIKEQNAIDVENAKKKGLSAAFIDRLTLTDKVIEGIAVGIEQVAALKSPRGKCVYSYVNQYQGVSVEKINVPFGVIGIIYESRPNVTADAFALCFKTANAVILKGGSDAFWSNKAIVDTIKCALKECGLPLDAVTLIEDNSRETTAEFMKLDKYVDLLIPRGSASLINATKQNATIPVIETGTGNCHVYVDKYADTDMAAEVIFNAKTQRYSVCNACESLVINSKIIDEALPKIAAKLKEKQVEMRCDDRSYEVIKDYPYLAKATEEDFYTEYGAAIISIKTVDCICEAIAHINEHSTHHSESIITSNTERAEKFLHEIDSSTVYHNASTRFSDGFEFGLGAEIGISTQKLHARGPMGLEALVTTKYVGRADGAVRK